MTFATIIVNHGTSRTSNQNEAVNFLKERIKEKYPSSLVRSFMASDKIRKNTRDKNLNKDLSKILKEFRNKNIKDVRFLMAYVVRGIEYEKVIKKAEKENEDGFFKFTFTKALLEEDYYDDKIFSLFKKLSQGETSLIVCHGSPKKDLDQFDKFHKKIKKHDNLYFSTFENRNYCKLIEEFERKNIKKIKIIPFFIISGNHVLKDIEGEKDNSYKKVFERNKIGIQVVKKSLILYEEISEILVEKLENS